MSTDYRVGSAAEKMEGHLYTIALLLNRIAEALETIQVGIHNLAMRQNS